MTDMSSLKAPLDIPIPDPPAPDEVLTQNFFFTSIDRDSFEICASVIYDTLLLSFCTMILRIKACLLSLLSLLKMDLRHY